ncbi:hypothetical protein BH11PAT1_BH11PAT1_2770 [soil metagenome]
MIQSLKNKVILLGVLILVLLLSVCVLLLRSGSGNKYTVTASSQTVIKQLQSLNRLETASFTIEKVIDAGTNGNQFQQILFGDRILLIASGKVIAGFDLSKLSANDVQIRGKTLRLTLPSPEILVTSLDNKETRVYDRKQGLLTKGDTQLEAVARNSAEQTIRQAACTGEILKEAEKNATSQMTTLFKSFQFEEVLITAQPGKC